MLAPKRLVFTVFIIGSNHTLLTETQNVFDEDVVKDELKKILKYPVHIRLLNPFELNFDGHECRFDGF